MAWEHFDVRFSGVCKIKNNDNSIILNIPYKMGFLTTGKQRVFWGNQILIDLPSGSIAGKSKGNFESYRNALAECNALLINLNFSLLVAGNESTYSESAMSSNSAMGYIQGHESPIQIMSPWPNI